MGINSINQVSSGIGERFANFTKIIAEQENALIGKILNGTITTEEQRAKERYNISNQSFEILSDEYRQLASKKNKSPQEFKKMQEMYKQGFLDFGESYMKYLDSKFGNSDNKLTEEEFVKSELDESMQDLLSLEEQKSLAKNIFSHLDINKDGIADKKEVAAMMSMFDMSVGLNGDKAGGVNGKIKAVDYNANALNLVKPSTEEGGAVMDTKMKTMYNFLFGNN